MVKLLLDENLRSDGLWQAIATQCGKIGAAIAPDILRVGSNDAPPLGTTDDLLLEFCAITGRILVTLDKSTMPDYLAKFLDHGGHSPGIVILHGRLSLPQLAEVLITIASLGDAEEFRDRCNWVP